MPTEQRMTYCSKCDKQTLHVQQTPNHILHLMLSVITAGAWLFVWLLFVGRGPEQCTICGQEHTFGDTLTAAKKNVENGGSFQAVMEARAAARKQRKAARRAKKAVRVR